MRTQWIVSTLFCLTLVPGCGGGGGGSSSSSGSSVVSHTAINVRTLRFTVTDLGAIPFTVDTVTINNSGQAAVTLGTGSSGIAHLVSQNTKTTLGTLGGASSFAADLNAQSQVVGESLIGSGNTQHAFLYSSGKMQDLGTLGGSFSNAQAINSTGQVVGQAQLASDALHAFLYSNGSLTDLGMLPGDTASVANSINDSGQIVGTSTYNPISPVGNPTVTEHAFLYNQGVMHNLGTLGGTFTEAYAINNSGQVVGRSALSAANVFPSHAFLYSNGKMQDLGTLGGENSNANAINSSGEVVGNSLQPVQSLYSHAFVYANGTMIDLNTTISDYSADAGTGWLLVSASGVNDAGQIVGVGRLNGQPHAFLLKPPPYTP